MYMYMYVELTERRRRKMCGFLGSERERRPRPSRRAILNLGGLLEQVNSSNESLMSQQGQVDERNGYGEEGQEFLNSNEDTSLEQN